jgi:signal transduction histidine kinase
MKTSILTRLLLLLLISYIPIAFVILWNNQVQRENAQQVAQDHALQQAQEIAFFHRQQIQEITDMLRLLSKLPMIQEWDMEACNQAAPELVSDFPNWFGFGVFDTEGNVRCSTVPESVGVNLFDRPYVQGPLTTGEVAISGYRLGTLTGRYTFVVVAPIFDADDVIRGAISIGIEPDAQSELIAQEMLQPDYRMTILDHNNTILLRYPASEPMIGTPYSEDQLRQMAGQTEGTFEAVGLDGDTRLYGFTVIEAAEATVLVSIDKTVAFVEVNQLQQRNLLVLGLTFTITCLLMMLASGFIATPLRQFSQVTEQFAKGDLSQRISMNSGILEIGQIQQTFNDMADSIEARIAERTAALVQANKQLADEIETRKKIETELERYTVQLRESNLDLEQFAIVASHDLREPLRKILMFSGRLERDNLTPEQRTDYLRRLQDSAERMILMTDNLLLYARIGQQPKTQTEVDLTTVVQKTVAELNPLVQEMQGSVHIDVLPTIQADAIQIYRLFQNLISNALKYHREGVPPVIRVTAQEDDQTIQIHVQDNGVGIPENHRERIFETFERLHTQSEGGGAGLGLAICRKIMRYHSGKITVKSTVGAGSVFILSFPRTIKIVADTSNHQIETS